MLDHSYKCSAKNILLCVNWIRNNTTKTKTFRPDRTTYGYKHYVESDCGSYIAEEEFVLACKRLKVERSYQGYVKLSINRETKKRFLEEHNRRL